MKQLIKKYDLYEFFKYIIVGGLAFGVDFIVLFIFREFIFQKSTEIIHSVVSITFGFIISFVFNYFVSLLFVFAKSKQRVKGKSIRSFIIVMLIAIIGFVLTQLFMYVGEFLFYFDYKVVKLIVAGIVLVWNYYARKKFVFK